MSTTKTLTTLFSASPAARCFALLAASLGFAAWYIGFSRVGPNSVISRHAVLDIEPPYVFRMLLPQMMRALVPEHDLDTALTRGLLAWLFTATSLWLMPSFLARMLDRELDAVERFRCRLALLAVLIAHYGLPRSLKFYYVYDLPAIAFAMMLFLLWTSRYQGLQAAGLLLAPVFALNRETAIVAVVLAAAWHASRQKNWRIFSIGSWPAVWKILAASSIAMLAVRGISSHLLNLPAQSSASWMDEGQFRLFANLQRILTKHHHALAVLWFGAGAIAWLPRRWHQLPKSLQWMLIASIGPFVAFALVGNIVELRMFSEFVPVLAAGLALPHLTQATTAAPGEPEPE
jgi:hypothetical protein